MIKIFNLYIYTGTPVFGWTMYGIGGKINSKPWFFGFSKVKS